MARFNNRRLGGELWLTNHSQSAWEDNEFFVFFRRSGSLRAEKKFDGSKRMFFFLAQHPRYKLLKI